MQNWELSKAITRKLSEISNNFIKTICLILLTCIRNSYQKYINCLCFGSNDNDNDCYKSTSWKPTLINLITYVNYDFSRKSKQISTKNPCEIRKHCIYDTLIVPTEAGTPRQGALKPPQMTLQSLSLWLWLSSALCSTVALPHLVSWLMALRAEIKRDIRGILHVCM